MPRRRKQMKQQLTQAKEWHTLANVFDVQLLAQEERGQWLDLLLPDLKDLPAVPPPTEVEAQQHQPPM